jgi:UPF0716 protein FxsA
VAGVLFLLFLVVPIAELAVIVQVGQSIGTLNTIALLVLVSVVGAALVKREGLGVLRRVQRPVGRGEVPGRELADGFLVLFGGALLLTPGFLSDAVGLALLLPPVRAVVRPVLLAQLSARAVRSTFGTPAGARTRRPGGDSGIIDV